MHDGEKCHGCCISASYSVGSFHFFCATNGDLIEVAVSSPLKVLNGLGERRRKKHCAIETSIMELNSWTDRLQWSQIVLLGHEF